jgi:general L-amino acid transport system permease protein
LLDAHRLYVTVSTSRLSSPHSTPIWRDVRFLRLAAQIAFVILVALAAGGLYANLQANLARRGLTLGYGFLESTAGFPIGETFIPYQESDTYGRALIAGMVNTLVVVVWGIALTTIVGVVMGIARLSSNWLIRQLAAAYVGLFRNSPLLIQLMFWYFGIILQLPPVKQAITLPGPTYLSQRGLYLTWPTPTESFQAWLPYLILALISPIVIRLIFRQVQSRSDRPVSPWLKLAYLVVPISLAAIGAALISSPPLAPQQPVLTGLNFKGGLRLSPEFAALLLGLVIYTGAFIAEVVRAGIQAVPRGQVEAARALGHSGGQVLRLVVFPQALRVIIPPLTSQYLNLAKNSSLAIAIGFPDLFSVAGTVFNQTGTAIEIILILMLSYLSMSLFTSLLLNIYNRRIQLVER